MRCTVFLGASIDGFIARADGSLDWLPGGEGTDCDGAAGASALDDDGGYGALLSEVDALLMGRSTYDAVLGLGVPWPYEMPVVVLTTRPLAVPNGVDVRTDQGPITEVLARLVADGLSQLYIDGGDVVQQALASDVIDRLIITTVPVLLGKGIGWAGPVDQDRRFVVTDTRRILEVMTQTTWTRDRADHLDA
jgi:dihydrofolate reductase